MLKSIEVRTGVTVVTVLKHLHIVCLFVFLLLFFLVQIIRKKTTFFELLIGREIFTHNMNINLR